MSFELAVRARISFGEGTLHEMGPVAAGMGSRALVSEGARGRASGARHPL